jgi:anti-sigma B factor antagonist
MSFVQTRSQGVAEDTHLNVQKASGDGACATVNERPFEWSLQEGVLVISFTLRRLVDDAILDSTFQQLNALLNTTGRSLMLLDFSAVRLLGTTALGRLITLEQQLKSRRGQLQLCGLCVEIRPIFQITRLDQYFRIHSSVDEGLRDF